MYRTQPTTSISSTTHVQLLEWLHGKKQQQPQLTKQCAAQMTHSFATRVAPHPAQSRCIPRKSLSLIGRAVSRGLRLGSHWSKVCSVSRPLGLVRNGSKDIDVSKMEGQFRKGVMLL